MAILDEINVNGTPYKMQDSAAARAANTYTKGEVDALVAAIKQFVPVVSQTLPTASADTMYKLYLVPSEDPKASNVKDEYITIDNGVSANPRYTWEKIGSTDIDLSDTPKSVIDEEGQETFIDVYQQALQAVYQAITDAQNAKADYVGDDNYVYHWDATQGRYVKTDKYVKGADGAPGTTDYNELTNKPTIPSSLSDLSSDSTHRTVTDVEKTAWNAKADAVVVGEGGTWPF